jgi:error-prone DNA polymerase
MSVHALTPLPARQGRISVTMPVPPYAELAVTSNFSFLRGASHPEELVKRARALGLTGLGIADRNSVAGVVRVHVAAEALNAQIAEWNLKLGTDEPPLKIAIGARLVFDDGTTPEILAYPQDRPAWGRLTRLLSLGKLRAEKGDCLLGLPDLLDFIAGLNVIVMPPARIDHAAMHRLLRRLKDAASPDSVWLAAALLYRGDDGRRLARLADLAGRVSVPLIAVNDVLYHAAKRRPLQDVVTCIREHLTIDTAGRRLEANAERHLKPPHEMARLFRRVPDAIAQTTRFLSHCGFSLDELKKTEYPDETRQGFATPQAALAAFAEDGARRRYPAGIPEKVRTALDKELELIGRLNYAPFFLTVHDIVRFAREEARILCQGRGSAANSAICYCLGITDVDPMKADLLFERFISEERNEPPDIDVDFEHERREQVIQYIYRRYGRDHAGLAATVICYRGRSAIREVGKVFGLSADTVGALAGSLWGWSMEGISAGTTRRAGFDPTDKRLRKARAFARLLMGFPRHLSQHVGGFAITRSRLDEVVPVENAAMEDRTVIEWDKDDLDALDLLKVDVLGLGMLSCLRRAFEFLETHYGVTRHLAIQDEDPATYRMIQRADTIGVFQIESRAQMSMLPRLKPEKFYDLVIEVAIVRPGPIQGDMVHPYLRRRQGLEAVHFPSPAPAHGPADELEQVLGRTLGVPLFQEQAMRIAIVAARFKPAEADKLRRAMATFKRVGTIKYFRDKFIDGMVARGYVRAFAERCFSQIEGFGEYGFPESHAASFANLVYASAWLKCRYPDVFAAALINSQPMGFYAPAQIVRDAQDHGIAVRPVDVNASAWDCTLELLHEQGAPPREHPTPALSTDPPLAGEDKIHPRHAAMTTDIRSNHALRLGFRQISGFREDDARAIERARGLVDGATISPLARCTPSPLVGEGTLDAPQVPDLTAAPRRERASGDGEASPPLRPFDSIRDLWLRTGLTPAALERLAHADAFRSLGLDRRDALWVIRALQRSGDKDDLPLFRRVAMPALEPDVALPPMPPGEHVVEDYRHLHLSLKAHPLSFLRAELTRSGIVASDRLATLPSGRTVTVAGLVLVRQRPGSASGVIFMTLEDETGIANTIVWPKIFETFRPVVLGARLVSVTGKLQNEEGVIHVVATRLDNLSPLLHRLSDSTFSQGLAPTDEVKRPIDDRTPRQGARRLAKLIQEEPGLLDEFRAVAGVMPKGRNFH